MLFVLKRATGGEFVVLRQLSVSPQYDVGTKPVPFQDIEEGLREAIVRLLNRYNNNEPDAAKQRWGLSGCYNPVRDQSVTVGIAHLPAARGSAVSFGGTSNYSHFFPIAC